MSESDTMFNERNLRCAVIQRMLSTDLRYNNRTLTSAGRWKRSFRLRLWSLVWLQVRATSCHLTSSKSAWKSTPKCTWMCWRVWWSPGAIRWPVADPGCGSRTRRRPTNSKRPRQKQTVQFHPGKVNLYVGISNLLYLTDFTEIREKS